MKLLIFAFVLAGLFGSVACGEKLDSYSGDGREIGYAIYIKPILDANCISCHGTNVVAADRNNAPETVNFDTYEAAMAAGVEANARIQANEMPPSGPLTAEVKDIFQQWVEEGMPE